ncbi:MAG: indole-3-glycerol phosphate synthase TrpC [Candidatus Omnitrophica bacterium]|nr:indole-3-glycerol phosphate synthase TrpC [Candidatus Omnitrophota bacterium]
MNKLEEILAHKRRELKEAKERRPLSGLERALKQRSPVRNFREAIRRPGRLSLIAEIKKASPSAGPIRPDADILQIAKSYEQSGAQAVSVLTDEAFFAGRLEDLLRVRENISLPVLRKDFLLEEYQVVESGAAGADAFLLIAAALSEPVLKRLIGLGRDLSLTALVEVHDERELNEALGNGAEVIGVNNRDLATFQVDLQTTERLFRRIPPDKTRVSESGIRSREDVEFVRAKGADAVLIGEELMSAPDPGKRIRELLGEET